MTRWRVLLACLFAAALAACSSPRKGGGYYQDDGPDARVPANLDSIPDAVPRIEPLASGANKPYVVFGKRYVPDTSGQSYRKRGVASWYGKKFHGNKTSNGETYDMYAMTAAHTTLPLPSYVRVTRVANGRSVVLRVNDRGPFHSDRIIDLSYVAAHKLGIVGPGSAEVVVERIMPEEIRNWSAGSASAPAPVTLSEPIAVPAAPLAQDRTSTQPPVSPAAAGSVYLQMGAFREPGNAQSLAARLGGHLPNGADAPSVSVRQHPDSLYRVRVGPYATREAALDAAHAISGQTGIMPSLAQP